MDAKAVQKLCYGLYIVASKQGDKINGQIANTVFQISSEPPTVAVSINKQNLTHAFIEASKVFSVSILAEDAPMTLIGTFGFKSGRDTDKFADISFQRGQTGSPFILEHVVAYVECEVINSADVGTHTVFIGKVIDGKVLNDAEPMTYAFYRQIKGGKSPKTAPTYIAEEKEAKQTKGLGKFRCTVCGHVYDPSLGDRENGIEPGTSFELLPETWTCPICNAQKSAFEKME